MVAATAQFDRAFAPGYVRKLSDGRMALADPSARRTGVDPVSLTATFVVSARTPDRVGDIVETKGISLRNFAANPTSFINHQGWSVWPLPIGQWRDPQGQLTITLEETRAIGTLWFSKSTYGLQTFELVQEGVLGAVSIGFNPLSPPVRRGDGEENPNSLESGFYFPSVDLLEISVCGVGCHPEAVLLREHLSKGVIAGKPIDPRFRKSLEPLAVPLKVWSPGFTPEKKAMDETDGESGGYVAAVQGVCTDHKLSDDHNVYHKGTDDGAAIHHQHPEGFQPEHAEAFKGAVEKCHKAIKTVVQGTAAPPDDTWKKCWPSKAADVPTDPDTTPSAPEEDKAFRKRLTSDKFGALLKADPELRGIVKAIVDESVGGPQPDAETETMPHGAALAHHVVDKIEEEKPKLEPEREKFWSKVQDTVLEHGKKTYPDHQWGSSDPAPDADDDEAQDERESDALIDQYRDNRPMYRKMLLASIRKRIVKRLTKRVKAVMGEAADHLEEMGGLDPKAFGKSHKTASMHHCKSIRDCMKDMDGGGDDMGEDEGGEESMDGKAMQEAVARAMEPFNQQIQRLTGKRA